MSSEAIIAKLGLDTKDFQKDLNGSVASVLKAHTQMMRAAKGQQSTTDRLGTSIRSAGKEWMRAGIATFTGPLLGVMAIGSLWEGVKAAKELDRELDKVLKIKDAKFSSISDLQNQLQSVDGLLQKINTHLGSTMQRSANDLKDRFEALFNVISNPVGAWNGEIKMDNTNVRLAKQEGDLKRDQLKLEEQIANKQLSQIGNQTIALTVSERAAEFAEAKRKYDEMLGAAAGKAPEVKQAMESSAKAQYRNELQQIVQKHDFMEEELRLQNEISKLQGSASQRSIAATRLEIAMLQKRLETHKDILSAEARNRLTVQINQKSRQLHDAQVERAGMTPQEVEAEKAQERDRRRAVRVFESRERGRQQNGEANSSDENRDARFAAAKKPVSLQPAGLSLRDQVNSQFAQKPLVHQVNKSAASLAGKDQKMSNATDNKIEQLLTELNKTVKDRLGVMR
ncbi:MAG TPA: hypothetical protein VNQ90_15625 [Chthoniobacteraceae bacterium]|nr:hypothetical protein [Chthoniobacteraceae bacterium]